MPTSLPKLLFLVLAVATPALCEPNWPAFRGPTGQGTTSETSLPINWSEKANIGWKTAIPGKGWSSPVIWGDEIWMTTAVEHPRYLQPHEIRLRPRDAQAPTEVEKHRNMALSLRAICVDRNSGRLLRDVVLFSVENPEVIHLLNSYASPTPVIEKGRLYCHFGTYGTCCLDTGTGEKIWERQFPVQHSVGPGSSPVIWSEWLVLVCDGTEAQYVMALDKNTGDVAWKTDRPPLAGNDGDYHKAFCTPLVISCDGVDQLLIPGAQWFVSYSPDNGNMLWRINHGTGYSNVAAPVFANGVSYLITGFSRSELWAIPVNSRGKLNSDGVLWKQSKQIPKKSSPAIVGKEIYVSNDNGVLSCIDIDTGKFRWAKRLGGSYSASPLVADGRIYLCSHEGKTTVVRPNPERYEQLAENQLDGLLMASPVASQGALFLRSDHHLYRLEAK
jgi:outer membrane protein assembly factor BamB